MKSQDHLVPLPNFAPLLWIPLLLATSACNKLAVENQPKQVLHVVLREGDYLSVPYIDQLERTRSPLAAGAPYGAHQFVVGKNNNLLELGPIFNFHEGGDTFTVRPDGSLVQPTPPYITHIVLTPLNESSFRVGFTTGDQTFQPTNYKFVGNASAYVAGVVLKGRYKDLRGLDYEFREDGYAVFAGRKFRFEIGLDHVLTNFDFFMEMGPNNTALAVTAFKREGADLLLFKTKEDENGFDRIIDHPYIDLKAE